MADPVLVLQYPDTSTGRTVALAATRNVDAILAFKRAVLEDARLSVIYQDEDDVLHYRDRLEMERLEKLLNRVVPDGNT